MAKKKKKKIVNVERLNIGISPSTVQKLAELSTVNTCFRSRLIDILICNAYAEYKKDNDMRINLLNPLKH